MQRTFNLSKHQKDFEIIILDALSVSMLHTYLCSYGQLGATYTFKNSHTFATAAFYFLY